MSVQGRDYIFFEITEPEQLAFTYKVRNWYYDKSYKVNQDVRFVFIGNVCNDIVNVNKELVMWNPLVMFAKILVYWFTMILFMKDPLAI